MSKKNKNRQSNQLTEETLDPVVQENDFTDEVDQENNEQIEQQEEQVSVEPLQEQSTTIQSEPVPEVKENQPQVVEEVEIKKPVSNKGVLIVERKPVSQVVNTAVPTSVEKFNQMAEQYITIMTGKDVSEEGRRKAVLLLTAIGNYVITSSDNRVFEACYSFFLKNRSIMLVVDRVTDGLYKYADKAKVTKIIQWYVTFQSLVESKLLKTNFTLNLTTIRRVFNNDALANWLIIKKK